jgi:hypothetical protein
MAIARLPDLAFICRHFQDLLGRKVTGILSAQKLRTGSAERYHAAWYELEDHAIVGTIAVDHSLAAHLATSICLVPATQAAAMVKTGILDDNAAENLFECLNVSSRFFHRAFETPVMIVQVAANPLRPGQTALPAESKRILLQPAQRIDVTLTIEGYGSGQIAVACS